MRFCALMCTLLTFSACAHKVSNDRIYEPWRFEARATRGEVKVLPLLTLAESPVPDLRSYVGAPLPWAREQIRVNRAKQLAGVPQALGEALPGAVNAEFGLEWTGQFHHCPFGMGASDKLRNALEGERPLDDTLADLAAHNGGAASLFTWVREVHGTPVSVEGFPGDTIETIAGPVLVDHADEPYVIWLVAGVALVTSDGEVLIRYEDVYTTVLSANVGRERAATDLAQTMAREVTKVWATDLDLDASGPLLAAKEE